MHLLKDKAFHKLNDFLSQRLLLGKAYWHGQNIFIKILHLFTTLSPKHCVNITGLLSDALV